MPETFHSDALGPVTVPLSACNGCGGEQPHCCAVCYGTGYNVPLFPRSFTTTSGRWERTGSFSLTHDGEIVARFRDENGRLAWFNAGPAVVAASAVRGGSAFRATQ